MKFKCVVQCVPTGARRFQSAKATRVFASGALAFAAWWEVVNWDFAAENFGACMMEG